MPVEFARFVREISAVRIGSTVNPYAREHARADLDRADAAETRAENLLAYLASRRGAELLLVGEAPGYRGCRFSGIPFTSERSLAPDRWTSRRLDGWQEQSATIVHGVLGELGMEEATVLWNAMPLHPAGSTPLTNRRPTAAELRAGAAWLHRLIELLRPRQVVAISRAAAAVLPGAPVLRHPAHGGADVFRAQLAQSVRAMSEGARQDGGELRDLLARGQANHQA